MQLIPVNPENLYMAWKDVVHFIEQGIEYCDNKYALQDIPDLIVNNKLTLWVVYNNDVNKAVGCLLTHVITYPQVKAFSIFLLAGNDFSQMMLVYDDLVAYAKIMECEKIEFYGRPGWEKTLKKINFEKTHIVMRLNI